nr:uncharacterized protein LOC107404226 [Ziziphus jujuba var. spinosa]
MEIKSSISTLFLFLLLLSAPYYVGGESDAVGNEIYEIDYRGPETHSSIPPPDHSHGKPLILERERAVGHPKSKGSTNVNASMGRKAKKVHG